MNSAAVNMIFESLPSVLDIYLGMELLDYMIILCFLFFFKELPNCLPCSCTISQTSAMFEDSVSLHLCQYFLFEVVLLTTRQTISCSSCKYTGILAESRLHSKWGSTGEGKERVWERWSSAFWTLRTAPPFSTGRCNLCGWATEHSRSSLLCQGQVL